MSRCSCILSSGPYKGTQCTYKSKPWSLYCGFHKNCKGPLPPQIREPQIREPQIREPQVQIRTSLKSPEQSQIIQEREKPVLSNEICPDELKPIDGACPSQFPNQHRLPDGSICCRKSLRKIRKLEQRPIKSKDNFVTHTHPSYSCYLQDYNIQYTPRLELVNRDINLSGAGCQSFDQALMEELPSLTWLKEQEQYLLNLDAFDQYIVRFYTSHGDQILNNFVRHRWSMTEDDMDNLRVNYVGDAVDVFKRMMKKAV